MCATAGLLIEHLGSLGSIWRHWDQLSVRIAQMMKENDLSWCGFSPLSLKCGPYLPNQMSPVCGVRLLVLASRRSSDDKRIDRRTAFDIRTYLDNLEVIYLIPKNPGLLSITTYSYRCGSKEGPDYFGLYKPDVRPEPKRSSDRDPLTYWLLLNRFKNVGLRIRRALQPD